MWELDAMPGGCAGRGEVTAVRFETPRGTRFIDTRLVILAVGQQAAPPTWLSTFDITTETHGNSRVDTQGRTTHSRIWAGGDNTLGPNLAVTAMAAGRRAAEGMLASFSAQQPIRRRA